MLARSLRLSRVSSTLRQFSTAPLLKAELPPETGGNVNRYAQSILAVAKKEQALDQVRGDLRLFEEAWNTNTALKSFLMSPTKKVPEKVEILKKSNMNPVTQDALRFLIEKKTLNHLPGILNVFEKLAAYEKKEVVAQVISADPLSKEQLEKVQQKLRAKVDPAYKLTIQTVVRPSILGGLIIQLGSLYQDLSVRRQLQQVESALESFEQ